jgi:hypothetical protein
MYETVSDCDQLTGVGLARFSFYILFAAVLELVCDIKTELADARGAVVSANIGLEWPHIPVCFTVHHDGPGGMHEIAENGLHFLLSSS